MLGGDTYLSKLVLLELDTHRVCGMRQCSREQQHSKQQNPTEFERIETATKDAVNTHETNVFLESASSTNDNHSSQRSKRQCSRRRSIRLNERRQTTKHSAYLRQYKQINLNEDSQSKQHNRLGGTSKQRWLRVLYGQLSLLRGINNATLPCDCTRSHLKRDVSNKLVPKMKFTQSTTFTLRVFYGVYLL